MALAIARASSTFALAKRPHKTKAVPARSSGFAVRDKLALLLQGHAEADAILGFVDALSSENAALKAEHDLQELRIKKLLFIAYGRKTEKLSVEEAQQLALAFGATKDEAEQHDPVVPHPVSPEVEAEEPATPEQDNSKTKKGRKRGRGTVVRADVERVVREVLVDAQERLCACCHREMQVIGHAEHESFEYIPAKLVLHVERREKLACRHSDCRGDIHAAPRPVERAEKRKAGPSLLAQLIEGKCHDALPIDRQRDQFERMGVTFPLNTLYSLWTYATELLLPVAKITCAQVLAEPIVAVDDTKLSVLDKARAGGSYKGCLWCFKGGRPLVAFTFTESWEADEIAPYIGAITGFIQCDDYGGYSKEVEWPPGEKKRVLVDPSRRLGCTMHVRRRFYDALKLGDKRAERAVEIIGKLYEIEAEAKALALGPLERLTLRTQRSIPLLDEFDRWVDDMTPKCTPTSPLASALGYASHQRSYIRRCFTDGRFEIDNGEVERAIRRPCIGRNNYLFTGSPDAAERLAGAYTLVLSCRNLGIPVRDYLIDVITKLQAGWHINRIAELVPDIWARTHGPLASREQAGQELR